MSDAFLFIYGNRSKGSFALIFAAGLLYGVLHIQAVMALARGRNQIEAIAFAHIVNLLLRGGIHTLMGDEQAV